MGGGSVGGHETSVSGGQVVVVTVNWTRYHRRHG